MRVVRRQRGRAAQVGQRLGVAAFILQPERAQVEEQGMLVALCQRLRRQLDCARDVARFERRGDFGKRLGQQGENPKARRKSSSSL